VKGLPTSAGAPFLAGQVAAADAGFVARMRAEGAIVIGKTNVPMFGLGGHSTNRVFGVTKNPYDRTRTAGRLLGRGGGGAGHRDDRRGGRVGHDGVAAQPRRVERGLRVPAHRGADPARRGAGNAGIRRLHAGPMAREIGDLAALLGTMSGGAFSGIGHGKGTAPAQPRIGWLGDWGGAFPMEQGILALAEAALARMEGRGLGGGAGGAARLAGAAVGRLDRFARLRRGAGPCGTLARPGRAGSAEPAGTYEIERGLALTGRGPGPRAGAAGPMAAALDTLFATYDALVLPARSSGPSRPTGTGRARSRVSRWTPITAGWRWWSRRVLPGSRRSACPRGSAKRPARVACN
jgi:amidase